MFIETRRFQTLQPCKGGMCIDLWQSHSVFRHYPLTIVGSPETVGVVKKPTG